MQVCIVFYWMVNTKDPKQARPHCLVDRPKEIDHSKEVICSSALRLESLICFHMSTC
jgi:hypothetical protein